MAVSASSKTKSRAKSSGSKLTDQQREFCQLLLTNPSRPDCELYMRAYPSCSSRNVASANAARLRKNRAVVRYLESARVKAEQRFEVTHERVMRELAAIAFLDPIEVLDPDGCVKDLGDMDESGRRALASVKVRKAVSGGTLGSGGVTEDVRFHSKLEALKLLASMQGYLSGKGEDGQKDPMQELFAYVQKRGSTGPLKFDPEIAKESQF